MKVAHLTLNECPHGQRSISLDDEGGGVRLTGPKCCGRWVEIQRWTMTPRLLRDAANELESAADCLEEKL